MSNDKFQEVKAEILRRAEQKEACKSQYSRANDASTVDEMLSVVKDNFAWCWHRQVVDIDLLNKLGEDVLWRNGIYTSGEHHLEFSQDATLFLLGSSQATIETWGSSQATIKTWGSSQATIETRESSQATIETRESSQATNVAQLPLKLYERVDDNERQTASDHPAAVSMRHPYNLLTAKRWIFNLS